MALRTRLAAGVPFSGVGQVAGESTPNVWAWNDNPPNLDACRSAEVPCFGTAVPKVSKGAVQPPTDA